MDIPPLSPLPANITYYILTPKSPYTLQASLTIQIVQFPNSAN